MILDDKHKTMLIPALTDRIERLGLLNQALPTDLLQEDITEHQDLVYQIRVQLPECQPVTDMDQEAVMYTQHALESMVEAKHYVENAGDKLMRLSGVQGAMLVNRMAAVYAELERIESLITEIYPQATEVIENE